MEPHEGHRDRLRKRFLSQGLESFDPHTALELILFYAKPRCDTNELAHQLINRFGSFSGVLDATLDEIESVKGVGRNTAILLKMMPQVASYYLADRSTPGTALNTTGRAGAFFAPKFLGKREECFYAACLDDKRKLLRCTLLEEGGITNAVSISVKKVVAEAISANATGVIVAHNHPGGVALPSSNDKWMTRQIHQALRMINISLVDHIIVADDDFVSLADSGFIDLLENGGGADSP